MTNNLTWEVHIRYSCWNYVSWMLSKHISCSALRRIHLSLSCFWHNFVTHLSYQYKNVSLVSLLPLFLLFLFLSHLDFNKSEFYGLWMFLNYIKQDKCRKNIIIENLNYCSAVLIVILNLTASKVYDIVYNTLFLLLFQLPSSPLFWSIDLLHSEKKLVTWCKFSVSILM